MTQPKGTDFSLKTDKELEEARGLILKEQESIWDEHECTGKPINNKKLDMIVSELDNLLKEIDKRKAVISDVDD